MKQVRGSSRTPGIVASVAAALALLAFAGTASADTGNEGTVNASSMTDNIAKQATTNIGTNGAANNTGAGTTAAGASTANVAARSGDTNVSQRSGALGGNVQTDASAGALGGNAGNASTGEPRQVAGGAGATGGGAGATGGGAGATTGGAGATTGGAGAGCDTFGDDNEVSCGSRERNGYEHQSAAGPNTQVCYDSVECQLPNSGATSGGAGATSGDAFVVGGPAGASGGYAKAIGGDNRAAAVAVSAGGNARAGCEQNGHQYEAPELYPASDHQSHRECGSAETRYSGNAGSINEVGVYNKTEANANVSGGPTVGVGNIAKTGLNQSTDLKATLAERIRFNW